MYNKSASAPELYTRSVETQTNHKTKTHPKPSAANISVNVEDQHEDWTPTPSAFTYITTPQESLILPSNRPCRVAFLSYVYVLLGIQVGLSVLQWLMANYRWRSQITAAERNLYLLMLLLTWLNLTLAFFGFRRLQTTWPLNWIVFACMCECLTLLVIFLCLREQDLAWYFIAISVALLLIYVPLSLWLPPQLTATLWILIFLSMCVLLISGLALISGLSMHVYLPLTFCVMLFGPWTMYNACQLHAASRDPCQRLGYLEHAAKMYIAFGCTVGGLVIVSRIADSSVETEGCREVVFCHKRSAS